MRSSFQRNTLLCIRKTVVVDTFLVSDVVWSNRRRHNRRRRRAHRRCNRGFGVGCHAAHTAFNIYFLRRNCTTNHIGDTNIEAPFRQRDLLSFRQPCLNRQPGPDQCTKQHVTGCTELAIEICDFHYCVPNPRLSRTTSSVTTRGRSSLRCTPSI